MTGRLDPSTLWHALREALIARRKALGISQIALDDAAGWANGQTAKFEADDPITGRPVRMPGAQLLCEWLCALRLNVALIPLELQPTSVVPAAHRQPGARHGDLT